MYAPRPDFIGVFVARRPEAGMHVRMYVCIYLCICELCVFECTGTHVYDRNFEWKNATVTCVYIWICVCTSVRVYNDTYEP